MVDPQCCLDKGVHHGLRRLQQAILHYAFLLTKQMTTLQEVVLVTMGVRINSCSTN